MYGCDMVCPNLDWEGPIVISVGSGFAGHELVPRNLSHRLQHTFVANSSPLDLPGHHPPTLSFVVLCLNYRAIHPGREQRDHGDSLAQLLAHNFKNLVAPCETR